MAFNSNIACLINYCNTFYGMSWNAVTVTALNSPYTIQHDDVIIECDVSMGPVTVQLATIPTHANKVLFIRRIDPSTTNNVVTVVPQTGFTVLGGASTTMDRDQQVLSIYQLLPASDWRILNNRFDQLTPQTTKGDLIVFSGTNSARLPVGANGLVLMADSTQTYGVKWASVAGNGDVVGPASSTDNAVVRWDGTTGKLIKNSGVILDNSNNFSGINNISLSGTVDGRDVSVDGSTLDAHIVNFSNPHNVTAAQVGSSVPQWNASQIQNIPVSSAAPADGNILVYNFGLNQWVPTNNTNYTLERITAVGGGAGVNPNITSRITFVTTTGSGTAVGTLINGNASRDGFEKIIIAENLSCPYVLTITSIVDAAGSIGTKTLTFNNTGQSARLIWSNGQLHWYISDTGATLS